MLCLIYYIYIICVPMLNHNNEFIVREIKMADLERGQLETGLEFVHCSFAERTNSNKGS